MALPHCLLLRAAAALHPSQPPEYVSISLDLAWVLSGDEDGAIGGSARWTSATGSCSDPPPPSVNPSAHGRSRALISAAERFALVEVLPGREQETADILQSILRGIYRGEAAALYLCGMPGSGKTAAAVRLLFPYNVLIFDAAGQSAWRRRSITRGIS